MNYVADCSRPVEPFNIASFCTGGGGFDLGAGLAIEGSRTVLMVEREAFCAATLGDAMEKGLLHPAALWTDVTTFRGREWRHTLDMLIAGYPCQPFSAAGKRLGTDDPRHIWPDIRRAAIQIRTPWLYLENVRGHLTLGWPLVLAELQRLGYVVEYGLFTAKQVGFTHKRERLFALCYNAKFAKEREQFLANTGSAGPQGRRAGDNQAGRQEPHGHAGLGGGELADANRQDRRRQLKPGKSRRDRRSGPEGKCRVLGDTAHERRGEGVSEQSGRIGLAASDQSIGELGHAQGLHGRALIGHESDGVGRGLPLSPPGPSDIEGWRWVLERAPELEPAVRRVAAKLAHRVDRLRMLGNGVHPLAAAYAIRTLHARLEARCDIQTTIRFI